MSFKNDSEEIKRLTGVNEVYLIGLAPSDYNLPMKHERHFNSNTLLNWKGLAEEYVSEDASDSVMDGN